MTKIAIATLVAILAITAGCGGKSYSSPAEQNAYANGKADVRAWESQGLNTSTYSCDVMSAVYGNSLPATATAAEYDAWLQGCKEEA